MVASHMPPTGDLSHNPGMCPDWESKQGLFGSQVSTQSTEPHQPGILFKVLSSFYLLLTFIVDMIDVPIFLPLPIFYPAPPPFPRPSPHYCLFILILSLISSDLAICMLCIFLPHTLISKIIYPTA